MGRCGFGAHGRRGHVVRFRFRFRAAGRVEKPRAYAEAGIPIYLLIDRDTCETIVYSLPVDGVYSLPVRLPFGAQVELPAPVEIALDTAPLKNWVR
ncbi:Uma2 family endonuclease [Nocardia sp. SYP-A9097]|uniref:Uma2 family endonuclease n=1 Tax=Nocardia sp. SYP-A9097 TaxID=2663237 RepID=UPI0035C90AD4